MATKAEIEQTILRVAGNRQALNAVEVLRVRGRMVINALIKEEPVLIGEQTHSGHEAIVDALRHGDAEKATRAMAEHLRQGCQNVLEALERTYMRRANSGSPWSGPHQELVYRLPRNDDSSGDPGGRTR